MALQVRRRKAAAEERRKARLAEAETATDQLNAAFDYFRGSMRAIDLATRPGAETAADPIRRQVAKQLIQIADQARQGQGSTT